MDCHYMDSLELMSTIRPTSGDNHWMSSSKSSHKLNVSEDRHQSHESHVSQQRHHLPTNDCFCWRCHKPEVDYSCKTCPRSYHQKCLSLKTWLPQPESCPQCIEIMRAEEGTNLSGCMQWLSRSVNKLAQLLEHTIITVKAADLNHSFDSFPTQECGQFVVNPMDLSLIEERVKNKSYTSTDSFLADIKWIYHNCFVLNSGSNNAIITEAKGIIQVAKQECEDIEVCPHCYLNNYTLGEAAFTAVCGRPHAIVWAKVEGYPYWPAKVVRYDHSKNEVDVRFFGTHQKCWLKVAKCYLISRDYPYNSVPNCDRVKFGEAIDELNVHLGLLKKTTNSSFRFYEKRIVFTVDMLYLTPTDQSSTPIVEQKSTPEVWSPPLKRHKKSFLEDCVNPKQKSSSEAIPIRVELSSSLDSDQTLNVWREGSKNNHSFICSNNYEPNQLISSTISSPALSQSQTASLSGQSSQILDFNNSIETLNHEMSDNMNQLANHTNDSELILCSKPTPKRPQKSKRQSELLIKSLKLENRELKDELIESNNRITCLEEDNKELKRSNEEMQTSITDLKRKKWCDNCFKEAVFFCCWNTYCTLECQNQHWPYHSVVDEGEDKPRLYS